MKNQRQPKKSTHKTSIKPAHDTPVASKKKAKTDISAQDGRIKNIGAHIKELRINKGYSSAEIFAYEHDLNRISYWRMERGSNITMNSLLRILDIHQITLSEFFKDIN